MRVALFLFGELVLNFRDEFVELGALLFVPLELTIVGWLLRHVQLSLEAFVFKSQVGILFRQFFDLLSLLEISLFQSHNFTVEVSRPFLVFEFV